MKKLRPARRKIQFAVGYYGKDGSSYCGIGLPFLYEVYEGKEEALSIAAELAEQGFLNIKIASKFTINALYEPEEEW